MAARLAGVEARWAVVGGWALDLYLGQTSRGHEDLEIIVPMWSFDQVKDRFLDFQMFVAGREGFWPVDDAGEAFFEYQQTIVRDPRTLKWKLDVMRVPDDGFHWIFTLDRSVSLEWSEAICVDSCGIPYLAPELVLLYKAANRREKDERDFAVILPMLSHQSRMWLRDTVERLMGTHHPWHGLLVAAT